MRKTHVPKAQNLRTIRKYIGILSFTDHFES